MSIYGSNSFVIEGENGKELYEKILNSVRKCVEYNTEYVLGEVNGKVYTIRKNKEMYYVYDEYIICVSEKDNPLPIAYSSFSVEQFKYENDVLTMGEEWCNSVGAFATYFKDAQMHKAPGFYYHSSSEADMPGCTNDVNGKYFKKQCVICDGNYSVGDDTIPSNYYDLSLEEQIAICKSLPEDEIFYGVTRIVNLNEIWSDEKSAKNSKKSR